MSKTKVEILETKRTPQMSITKMNVTTGERTTSPSKYYFLNMYLLQLKRVEEEARSGRQE